MKRVRLKDEGIDICVTIDVKSIFLKKSGGKIKEELERADISRIIQNLGSRHEGPVAKEIAIAYKAQASESTNETGD